MNESSVETTNPKGSLYDEENREAVKSALATLSKKHREEIEANAESNQKRVVQERADAYNQCRDTPGKFPTPEQVELVRQYVIRKKPFTKEHKQLISGWNQLVDRALTHPIKRIIATDFGGKLADWKEIIQTAWIEQGNPKQVDNFKSQGDETPSTVPPEPAEGNGGKTVKEPIKPPLKAPSEKAKAAWMLQEFKGIKTQSEIAKTMTQNEMKTDQPAVSRLLKEFREYLAEGGIAPTPPKDAVVETFDPAILDMGSREDGHTERQRQKKSE